MLRPQNVHKRWLSKGMLKSSVDSKLLDTILRWTYSYLGLHNPRRNHKSCRFMVSQKLDK